MKRVAVALVVLGVLGVLASAAQAHTPAVTTAMAAGTLVGHGPYGHHHGPGYVSRTWYPPVVVGPPRVIVAPPRATYVPVPPPCYRPHSGIYYSNRGVSFGIGF